MSKKMLKRSLALGALMAFVITGSAWAEEINVDSSDNNVGLSGVSHSNTQNLDLTEIISVSVKHTGTRGATGVNLENGSSATLGAITIDATSQSANGFGFRLIGGSESENGITTYSGNTVAVNGNATIIAKGADYAQGIYSQYSDITFDKDAIITATSTGNYAYAVRMLGDTDSETYKFTNSKITFNGDLTKLNAKSEKYAWGIVTSGGNEGAGAYFNGQEVKVDVEAGYQAVGVHAQYGTGAVASSVDTAIEIKAKANNGSAYGVATDLYSGEVAGKVDFNGNVTINAEGNSAYGVEAVNGSSVELGSVGKTVSITATSQSDKAAGVLADESTVTINGTSTITATSNGNASAYGVRANAGSEVTLDSANVTVVSEDGNGFGFILKGKTEEVDGVKHTSGASINVTGATTINVTGGNDSQGVYGEYSQVTFGDNVTINAIGASDYAYAVRMLGDRDSETQKFSENKIVFDGAVTNLKAESANISHGLMISGCNNSGAEFNGGQVNIEADGDNLAYGLLSQYGANTVASSEDSSVKITAKSEKGTAYGIYSTLYAGDKAGTVDLKGNVTVKAEGNSAYGVEALNGAGVSLGSADKVVSITANGAGTDGEAIAVFAKNAKSEVDITAGTLTVNATSENDNQPGSSLQAKDGAVVNVTANKATINGMMYAGAGATLDISGIKELVLTGLTKDSDAAIQVEGGTLKVNNTETGTLAIEGAEAGNTYKVVSGVADKSALWSDTNLAYDRTTMVATSALDETAKLYTVKYESFNDVTKVTDDIKEQFVEAVGGEEKLAVSNLVAEATGQGAIMAETAPGAKEFLADVSSDVELKPEQKAAVINSAAKLAEAGGNAGTAASVANNVSSVTTGRMSFGGRGHGGHKGGHGVGLFEEGSGAAVWAQYMHGKDDATDMPMDGGATSYESEYDGIVVGVDFKKVGKFQSGIAFNYGEGDSNGFGSGIKTSSEYDFWGVGYYGNIRNEDTNFIFDVNYAKSDSDVTQDNPAASAAIEASPETTTWSAGVKVEKLYQNNNVQIVPYTGLRYMSIDTDEYQSNVAGKALFNYAPERQDIWLLPLGVTIKQEVVNDNGWVVTPKVDLSYIWAFGDTDSNMSVSIPGIAASNDTLGFTVMDDGSFLGLVGVEAKLDDWTFGVSYSYQKGDYAESKKWFVDAKYSF